MSSTEPEVMTVVEGSARGRPMSWVVVALVILGFLVGGLGLMAGPSWWLFWTGAGLVLVGIVVGWATGIMEDVH
jgi:hypothetical protein